MANRIVGLGGNMREHERDIGVIHVQLTRAGATVDLADLLITLYAQVQELQKQVRILRGEE